jgi:hypothetical protein
MCASVSKSCLFTRFLRAPLPIVLLPLFRPRCYIDPLPDVHPSIFAAQQIVQLHTGRVPTAEARGQARALSNLATDKSHLTIGERPGPQALKYYIDIHTHSSKKGLFMYVPLAASHSAVRASHDM